MDDPKYVMLETMLNSSRGMTSAAGVDGAEGCNVGVVTGEDQSDDDTQGGGQQGAHPEIPLTLDVEVVQQGEKYQGQQQCAPLQRFKIHVRISFLSG